MRLFRRWWAARRARARARVTVTIRTAADLPGSPAEMVGLAPVVVAEDQGGLVICPDLRVCPTAGVWCRFDGCSRTPVLTGEAKGPDPAVWGELR